MGAAYLRCQPALQHPWRTQGFLKLYTELILGALVDSFFLSCMCNEIQKSLTVLVHLLALALSKQCIPLMFHQDLPSYLLFDFEFLVPQTMNDFQLIIHFQFYFVSCNNLENLWGKLG